MAKTKTSKRRPPRQLAVPGTEGKRIKEVDDAAEDFVEIRDERLKLVFKEGEAHRKLVEAMEKHGIEIYRDDSVTPPLIVKVAKKTTAKVKREKPKDQQPDDDSAEAA